MKNQPQMKTNSKLPPIEPKFTFEEFVDMIIQDMGEDSAAKFIAQLAEAAQTQLISTLLAALSEDDMTFLDNLKDEKETQTFLETKCQEITGMGMDAFSSYIQYSIAERYVNDKDVPEKEVGADNLAADTNPDPQS